MDSATLLVKEYSGRLLKPKKKKKKKKTEWSLQKFLLLKSDFFLTEWL